MKKFSPLKLAVIGAGTLVIFWILPVALKPITIGLVFLLLVGPQLLKESSKQSKENLGRISGMRKHKAPDLSKMPPAYIDDDDIVEDSPTYTHPATEELEQRGFKRVNNQKPRKQG